MSGHIGLESLSHSFFGIETGTWWVLSESYTRWSSTRSYHPWLVTFASARLSFYHGMPRTRRGNPPSVPHEPHVMGHEPMCYLESSGWVVVSSVRQLPAEYFVKPSWYSCMEPADSDLLDRIDDARGGRP